MKKIKLIAATTLFSSLSMAFGATTLQFDIGGGTLFDGTDNATNAPAGIADTFYNGISGNGNDGTSNTSGISTSLVFSDGTAATGVVAEIGDGSAAGLFDGTIGTGSNNNGAFGTGTGIAGTELTNDWIFTRNGDNLGFRVSGLEAGTYDVFALVREPNAPDRTYDVGIGVGDTNDISTLSPQAIGAITDISAFADGGNFVSQRVVVTGTDDFITIIVDPTNANFATLGGVQIVSVPEPSSVALLGLGFVSFALRRRR